MAGVFVDILTIRSCVVLLHADLDAQQPQQVFKLADWFGLTSELRTGVDLVKPDVLEGLALPKSAAQGLNL